MVNGLKFVMLQKSGLSLAPQYKIPTIFVNLTVGKNALFIYLTQ